MLIVPENDTLAIDARLGADKVDQVRRGQTAHVRLSAFNQHTTPELPGVVTWCQPTPFANPSRTPHIMI